MSYAVFFDVLPKGGFADAYFGMAADLKPVVEQSPGFISVERFENLSEPGWYLSFSRWADEEALSAWRCQKEHQHAQVCGRDLIFENYRLRVGFSTPDGMSAHRESGRYILSVIGGLNNLELALKANSGLFPKTPKIFRGVMNSERGLALVDIELNISYVEASLIFTEEQLLVDAFNIQRDYGMFDRAQAPGVFA